MSAVPFTICWSFFLLPSAPGKLPIFLSLLFHVPTDSHFGNCCFLFLQFAIVSILCFPEIFFVLDFKCWSAACFAESSISITMTAGIIDTPSFFIWVDDLIYYLDICLMRDSFFFSFVLGIEQSSIGYAWSFFFFSFLFFSFFWSWNSFRPGYLLRRSLGQVTTSYSSTQVLSTSIIRNR